jgi:cytochrome c oxidase subunit 2
MRDVLRCLPILSLLSWGACVTDSEPWKPVETLAVEVVGHDFRWYYRFPGRDGVLGTPDDLRASGPLHLPVGADIELRLTSRDFVYQLELPHLALKEIAVPDLTFSMEFSTDREGRFELRGDEFCGFAHESLITELVVESQDRFHDWLEVAGRAGQAEP